MGSLLVAMLLAAPTSTPADALDATGTDSGGAAQRHGLDDVSRMAKKSLTRIRNEISDYSALLIKRERIEGKLGDTVYAYIKIRERNVQDGEVVVPLSIYSKILKPRDRRGEEMLWVEGRDDGKVRMRRAPRAGIYCGPRSLLLKPETWARFFSKYPIQELGLESIVRRMVAIAEDERRRDKCNVNFYKGATINDRVCTMVEIVHPVKREHFGFHIMRIYIDDELGIPIRQAAWDWPEVEGGKPELLEEYTYLRVKINQNFTDRDFDADNPKYGFFVDSSPSQTHVQETPAYRAPIEASSSRTNVHGRRLPRCRLFRRR
ncbi:MAG: DUF1571 domain-containing protein [Planctomycetes bacterium]|nr:DUF1571 domain-containing protein [Planctomycetota bacterium]